MSNTSKHMFYIISILIKRFSEPSCTLDGGGIVREDTIPNCIEMFHHRIKVISQNNSVVICSVQSKGTSGPKTCQKTYTNSIQHNRATVVSLVCFFSTLCLKKFSASLLSVSSMSTQLHLTITKIHHSEHLFQNLMLNS